MRCERSGESKAFRRTGISTSRWRMTTPLSRARRSWARNCPAVGCARRGANGCSRGPHGCGFQRVAAQGFRHQGSSRDVLRGGCEHPRATGRQPLLRAAFWMAHRDGRRRAKPLLPSLQPKRSPTRGHIARRDSEAPRFISAARLRRSRMECLVDPPARRCGRYLQPASEA